MPEPNCVQLAKENNWDIEVKNACHISVLNSETGELRDAQVLQNTKIEKLNTKVENNHNEVILQLRTISLQTGVTTSVLGLIGTIVIGWVVKKILDSIKLKNK